MRMVFYRYRRLRRPRFSVSLAAISRAYIRVRHFAESGKNRNAHVAERASRLRPRHREVTRVDRGALALGVVVDVDGDGNRDVTNAACRLACR